MTSNQIAYWRNVETERANRAQLEEAVRHNKASESIGRAQVSASLAATAATYASIAANERIAAANLAETRRYHDLDYTRGMVSTAANYSYNMDSLAETIRHNQATELTTASRSEGQNFRDYVAGFTTLGSTVAGLIIGSAGAKMTGGKH